MRARSNASLILTLAGLGGICVSAVLAVGFAVDPSETVPAAVERGRDPGVTADTNSNAPVGNPLWGVPLSAMSATTDRPIFSPSRRPPAPPIIGAPPPAPRPPPPPTQEADRPPLVLVGTAVGGSRRLGVFLEEITQKLVRLEPGNGHDGWSLRRVERREAQFEKAPRTAILALRPGPGPEPAASSLRAPMLAQPAVGPQPVTGSVGATPQLPPQPATVSVGASATESIPAVYHRKR
jgi:general secretion pathway protein N